MAQIGFHHGRTDLERMGLFAEMEYMHGAKYISPILFPKIRDMKIRQMYPGFPKWKADLQDCYFDNEFKRIFEGEGLDKISKLEARKRPDKYDIKIINKKEKLEPIKSGWPGKFFDPNPSAGGPSGMTYNKLVPEKWTISGPFKPAAPGKKKGGMMGGCFSKFPEYMESRYLDPWRITLYGPKGKKEAGPGPKYGMYKAGMGRKTMATKSVMALNVDIKVNAKNYKKAKPITFTREFF